MDIKSRIVDLEDQIAKLRVQWKTASVPMRKLIEQQAREKQKEIRIFESVLRRRGDLPPRNDPQQKLL